jgi:flagella basal body P-ring formation protein FlgA
MGDKRMVKKALIFIFLLAFACDAGFGAYISNDVPSRMTKAIISCLISKDPIYSGKKIEVTYKYADKTFRDLKARQGKVTFAIAELYPDFKPIGNIIVPVQVIVDDIPKEKIFLRTRVSVFDNIVVAKKRLKRGDVLSSAEAGVEERDVAVLNSDVIKDMNLVLGREVKTFVTSGNPIYSWMIREKPFVKKTEKVKILAGTQNVLVSVDGIALEDGNMGSEVKVRNTASGKEVIGEVTGTGEVTIK